MSIKKENIEYKKSSGLCSSFRDYINKNYEYGNVIKFLTHNEKEIKRLVKKDKADFYNNMLLYQNWESLIKQDYELFIKFCNDNNFNRFQIISDLLPSILKESNIHAYFKNTHNMKMLCDDICTSNFISFKQTDFLSERNSCLLGYKSYHVLDLLFHLVDVGLIENAVILTQVFEKSVKNCLFKYMDAQTKFSYTSDSIDFLDASMWAKVLKNMENHSYPNMVVNINIRKKLKENFEELPIIFKKVTLKMELDLMPTQTIYKTNKI